MKKCPTVSMNARRTGIPWRPVAAPAPKAVSFASGKPYDTKAYMSPGDTVIRQCNRDVTVPSTCKPWAPKKGGTERAITGGWGSGTGANVNQTANGVNATDTAVMKRVSGAVNGAWADRRAVKKSAAKKARRLARSLQGA